MQPTIQLGASFESGKTQPMFSRHKRTVNTLYKLTSYFMSASMTEISDSLCDKRKCLTPLMAVFFFQLIEGVNISAFFLAKTIGKTLIPIIISFSGVSKKGLVAAIYKRYYTRRRVGYCHIWDATKDETNLATNNSPSIKLFSKYLVQYQSIIFTFLF